MKATWTNTRLCLTGAPIYDYRSQRWTQIDPGIDRQLRPFVFKTPDGVTYEINPDNPSEYRNLPSEK